MNDDKTRLIINIARMYYEYELSQKEIAEKLNLSRAYVSQLLSQAREEGIVQVKINDPFGRGSVLEEDLRAMFGLKKVIIVPTVADDSEATLQACVRETCKYLNAVVESGMTIAYSWGYTIYSCSRLLSKRMDITDVSVIPLCGGVSNLEKKVYVSEISQNISAAFNGTAYYIPLPSILRDVETKRAVLKDPVMSSVLDMANQADIALFTVGTFGTNSALYNAGYISPEEMECLNQNHVVGDICARFIDINGDLCDPELDDRTISVDLTCLATRKHRICVVQGKKKVGAMIGALRKGYPNVLITDEDTGKGVLEYCMRHLPPLASHEMSAAARD